MDSRKMGDECPQGIAGTASHILIGPPSSGKSTCAKQLAQCLAECRIISTDEIRLELYGSESTQGQWDEIEVRALDMIGDCLQKTVPVIYDATNAKRAWRLDLLQKLPGTQWIGWHLTTPLDICKHWNQQRSRQVPETVIESMAQELKKFPPIPAEGFLDVLTLDPSKTSLTPQRLLKKIKAIPRTLINRQNATQQATLHGYSQLLDFERLLYLLSILIHHPGSDLEEIEKRLATEHGSVYVDPTRLTKDLVWLEQSGLLGIGDEAQPLIYPDPPEARCFATHSYSDWESFSRLFSAIRLILTRPFQFDEELGSLSSLCQGLQQQGWVKGEVKESIRKDIEKILKPYQILPSFPIKRGYFTHTGIFSRHELKQIYRLLQVSTRALENPWEQGIYEMANQRMQLSRIDITDLYPVRQLGNQSIIDPTLAPSGTLGDRRGIEIVEQAIQQGDLLEVKRLPGAHFPGEQQECFRIWPLQLVFHQIAWYLGCEYQGEARRGLLRFERLDRLFLNQRHCATRTRKEQETALKRLHKLYDVSAGIFLGNDPALQKLFLSRHATERSQAEMIMELWFSDRIFPFVSEGTRRFRYQRMSPRLKGTSTPKSLFNLPGTDHPQFPHRLKVNLPLWSLEDVDLKRWIVGFGGEVLVISPMALRQLIWDTGRAVAELYSED